MADQAKLWHKRSVFCSRFVQNAVQLTTHPLIRISLKVPSTISDDVESSIENGRLIIKASELREVFDKVIQAIFVLIVQQIERVQQADPNGRVSAILLVGGFGSSEYLRKSIEEHFGEDMKIIQPPEA
jgi:Tfp pilus assembly PilM family ATPase